MKCRIGDLAVVVRAELRNNIGCIVKVIGEDDGRSELSFFTNEGKVWTVTSGHPLTWRLHGKLIRQKTGPVPDNRLRPIRGVLSPSSKPRSVVEKEMLFA